MMAADDAPLSTVPADLAAAVAAVRALGAGADGGAGAGSSAGSGGGAGAGSDAVAGSGAGARAGAGSDGDAGADASAAAPGRGWRATLLDVHEVLMRARVAGGPAVPVELAALGEALKAAPAGSVRRLPPRAAILLELLRGGFTEPAWVLAHDNASGQIRPERAVATWAGRSALREPLPVPFVIEDGAAYAFLPGFRDPRWQVPDEVYRLPVGIDCLLDEARVAGGRLLLTGAASLTVLPTAVADRAILLLRGPEKREVRIPAERARRPDLGLPHGPERDRLAWSGWSLSLPLAELADQLGPAGGGPARWHLFLELSHRGLTRRAPLGTHRGPTAPAGSTGLAPFQDEPTVTETGAITLMLAAEPPGSKHPGQLVLRVRPLGRAARIVPRPLRKLARTVVATIDEKVDRAVDGPR